jgi:ADP-ribose pyrophosphatase
MGLAVGALRHIGGFLLTPGGSDEVCELYAGHVTAPQADADGIAGHAGMASEHEDIRVRVWPAERAIEAALAGQLPNSVTAIGLLWLAARRAALREEWSKP